AQSEFVGIRGDVVPDLVPAREVRVIIGHREALEMSLVAGGDEVERLVVGVPVPGDSVGFLEAVGVDAGGVQLRECGEPGGSGTDDRVLPARCGHSLWSFVLSTLVGLCVVSPRWADVGGVGRRHQRITSPPESTIVSPVMKPASGEPRMDTQRAISSGWATRPSGTPAAAAAAIRPVTLLPGVSTQPGAIALTRMPWSASSRARFFVAMTTAAFEAP